MSTHWPGLTVFVEHPEVPMDNNSAERAERGPVVGRKNYYGSGAVWAGQLAAVLFSVFETLKLWGVNECPAVVDELLDGVCGQRGASASGPAALAAVAQDGGGTRRDEGGRGGRATAYRG